MEYYVGERKLDVKSKDRDGRRVPISSIPRVEHVWEFHHNVARLIVLGYNNKQIAQMMGKTPERISHIRNSPMVIRLIEMMRAEADQGTIDVRSEIQALAPKAIEIIKSQLEDEHTSPHLKFKGATYLLGLAGHVAPKNVNVRSVHTNLSPDQIEKIKSRAVEIGMNSGLIADESLSEANTQHDDSQHNDQLGE